MMQGGSLERLFGALERRRALQRMLAALLAAERCYVLTANMALKRVEEALNALLASNAGGRAPPASSARFVMNETIRFAPRGAKLPEIDRLLTARGFTLVASSQRG